jgi:collagenase-like PrtC family protease
VALAGDMEAMRAALANGAGAVGLRAFGGRHGLALTQADLLTAIAEAHAQAASLYLVLDAPLAEREVGRAMRFAAWACEAGVDALRIGDFALLNLAKEMPRLSVHLASPGVANSVDVAAAGDLGIARVPLGADMTLNEMARCSAVEGVMAEMPVEGDSCRSLVACLLGSWLGDRGACRRACGDADDGPLAGRPRLNRLIEAGVGALRIEAPAGSAAWLGAAVGLYRRALDGPPHEATATINAGRDALTQATAEPRADDLEDDETSASSEQLQYDLSLDVEQRGIVCRFQCGGQVSEWTMPKTVVRRVHKAVPIGRLFERLEASPLMGAELGLGETNDPDFLLVPRAYNSLVDTMITHIRRAQRGPREQVKADLPPTLRAMLESAEPHPANRLQLGDPPSRVRVEAGDLEQVVREIEVKEIIVEGLRADSFERACRTCRLPMIVAFPPVFLEAEAAELARLARSCAKEGVVVEVNSLGGWRVAREARARVEAGPGLAVLNSLAARWLAGLGMRSVTLSLEADRRQLEEISARCPVPCSLTVFGRPVLWMSRVEPREPTLTDSRGGTVTARRERGLWVYRPDEPFDLRNVTNERVRARNLVVDLVGSPDATADWLDAPLPGWDRFRFRYESHK